MKTILTETIRRSPFFYVGDKFKLVPQLKEHFPTDIERFIEPFCGGGSVFLNVEAESYLVNDIVSEHLKNNRTWDETVEYYNSRKRYR